MSETVKPSLPVTPAPVTHFGDVATVPSAVRVPSAARTRCIGKRRRAGGVPVARGESPVSDHPYRLVETMAAAPPDTGTDVPLRDHPAERPIEVDAGDIDLDARHVYRTDFIERDLHDSIEGAAHLFHHL